MFSIRTWFKAAWPPLVAIVLLLAIWQTAAEIMDLPRWMLPSPLDIANEGLVSWQRIQEHLLATLGLTLYGFAIGTAVGLIVAFVLHMIAPLRTALYPLMILSQNVPMIALAPLLMIWFGFGLLPKLIVITLVCFFPVAVAALNGLAQTDSTMLTYMKMAGASRRQIFTKLELPSSLPSLFAGLKISATYSVMGAVIGEWLGTERGLGMYMLLQKNAFRTDRVFVAIALIVLLSLIIFGLIALLERWLIRSEIQKVRRVANGGSASVKSAANY
ncbi:ABC transporter permease [Paenibacillus senegalensis]|uniref:ABC transporter permease n=1 Tax=Paenibacillus senegalensis TaxID=1465766 RepID=UPI0002890E90|nr:ABC transporter permease [Paenibacillus senegalensis]